MLLAAVACGVLANVVRPDSIPWRENWSHRVETKALALGLQVADLGQARAILDEGIYFVFDAREPGVYEEGHLPGALSLPGESFDESVGLYIDMLIPEQEIMVYCSGLACDESLQVCEAFLAQGYTNLVLFAGGYEAWEADGLPTEVGP